MSAAGPGAARPEVVLHVGMGKTGSTTIQTTFHRNRRLLAQRGILYPKSPGKRRHVRLGLAIQTDRDPPPTSGDWRRQDESQPSELRPTMRRGLLDEVRRREPSTLVLSDEALLGSDDPWLPQMRDLLDDLASRTTVVAYLRRQDDHLTSRYQQVVKLAGEQRRLSEWARRTPPRVYDFRARLSAWSSVVRPEALVVRVFEPVGFVGSSLLADFLDAASLPVAEADLTVPAPRNESLDAESVEFLRILNLHRHEASIAPDHRTSTRIATRLMASGRRGPTLTLAESELDAFMEQWEAGNAATARDFFGRSTLFGTGRKTRNTTAVQRLDPGRLDHFLDVAEIPSAEHAAIRRIAEREARSG